MLHPLLRCRLKRRMQQHVVMGRCGNQQPNYQSHQPIREYKNRYYNSDNDDDDDDDDHKSRQYPMGEDRLLVCCVGLGSVLCGTG